MSWWRRLTLRSRLLIIGVVGLSVGLTLGGVAFVGALGYVLQRSVDADAERTGRDVAALVDLGAVPQPVPVAGAQLVQVIDSAGRVRSASPGADRLVSLLAPDQLRRARAGERLVIDGEPLGLSGPVRVVAVPAGPADDPQTVVVARSVADVVRGIGLLRTTLFVVFPLLVIVLAGVAWRVIGATLRPVEGLRRGAEEITGAGRAERLPVPAGRDEVHRLAVTLNGMLDRLDAGRARQREFVADAAHELRTPLANMRTQLEVAARLGTGADWSAVSEDLLIDNRRLSRLVDDLLLLARTDAASTSARFVTVDLAELAAEVAARYPAVAVSIPDGPLWTHGDPAALGRAVANLLDNAVRHARTGVWLTAVSDGAYHLVTVTDDGPGIPEEDRERVFERFTRLDDARARDSLDDAHTGDDGGAGLGLAIVAEIIRHHDGLVQLADAGPNPPGLRVELRLPRLSAS